VTATQVELVVTLLTAVGALCVAVGTLVWFISDQFKKNRALFWKGLSELHNTIVAKIDDHQKDDNRRFAALQDAVWDLRLHLARRNGSAVSTPPGDGA